MFKKSLIIALPLLVFAYGFLFMRSANQTSELLELGELGAFSFTNSEGEEITQAAAANSVSVFNLFFTRCKAVCPALTANLVPVAKQFADEDVVMISISVDPKYDTDEAIKKFKTNLRADYDNWHFVRGELDDVKHLMQESFKIGTPENPEFHSTRVVLVDKKGVVRGLYAGLEMESIDQLRVDIKSLL